MDWAFNVSAPRDEIYEAIYAGANRFGSERFPALMQEAINTGNQAKQIEAAKLADLVMYQLRVALSAGIGLVAATVGPKAPVKVSFAGRVTLDHAGQDMLTVIVSHDVVEPETTQEEGLSAE